MSLDKKITDFLENQIPDYVQEYYPIFVIFVTKYYEWLEQGGNPQEIIQNIQLNSDIDTTASSLATKFVNTYAPNLPQTAALDRAVLVKNFRDFYRSKGSTKSFEFFFRAFFNDAITVKLPGDQLFRTSDGDWYIEKTLRVQAITGDPVNLQHTTIVGNVSKATAVIEHAVQNYGLWDLTLQNRSLQGVFNSSETITGTYWIHTADTSISSQIVVQNTAPVIIVNGIQRGTHSQLSADQIIQDSIYWQKFSYVIRTRITLDRWKNAVLEQLHPSGRNIFGEIFVDIDTSVAVSAATTVFAQTNAIYTEVNFSTQDSFYILSGYTFDRLANGKTGTSTTNSAGGVTYDSGYTYGGENITFALQNAADNERSFIETFTYTSLTGRVFAATTTGVTASNRDFVSYVIPVTSITGTISGPTQPLGGEMVITGTGTYFDTELSLNNIWRYKSGVDGLGNPIYEYYSSVLTILNLPVTGTVTLAQQTPIAPNYYYYLSGTNTKFLSDLLVTGGDTSTGISNETNQPIIFPGERRPQIVVNAVPMAGNVQFTSGTTDVTDPDGKFLSQLYAGGEMTVIKQLSGRLLQVSSLPAIASSWAVLSTATSIAIVGSSLTTVNPTSTSRTQESSLSQYTDPALWGRWDLNVPFPVFFIGTSTTKLYVHSTGMIAFDTSVASHGNSGTDGAGPSSFQPAVPKIAINPHYFNKLKTVYSQAFGSAPDRTFKIYYDGWYSYPEEYNWSTRGIGGIPDEVYGQPTGNTSNVLTTGVGLTVSTTPTSGTVANGYWQVTIPWNLNFFSTSYNQIFITHHGRIGIGDWYDGSGNTLTTNVTTTNALTYAVPNIPRIEPMYVADSQPASQSSPWQLTQNNPRFGNRIYYGALGTAPNRTFRIRWEGGFFSTSPNDRVMGWEVSFNENNFSSVTLHGAITPYQQQFNAAALNAVTVPLWKIAPSGQAIQEPLTYSILPGYNLPYGSAGNAQNTSYQITFATDAADIVRDAGIRQRWETTFHENSSLGVFIQRIANDSLFLDSPRFRSTRINYLYWTDAQLNLIYGDNSGQHRQKHNQYSVAAVSAITSILGFSSSTSMLFRLASVEAVTDDRETTYLTQSMYWSSALTGAGAQNPADVTSLGVVARWPRDGYLASSGNVNPEPTCSSYAVVPVTIPASTYTYPSFTLRYFVDPTSSNTYWTTAITVNLQGYLFSYGSSASTNNRWVMTTPTYGSLHAIRVNGYINSSSSGHSYNLAPLGSGQNLELWYSTAENPTPPIAGQTPAAAGWTKMAATIWSGINKSTYSTTGLMFNPADNWSNANFATNNYTGGTGGYFAIGRAGRYVSFPQNKWVDSVSAYTGQPFKCTWLIYQSSYTAQSTPDQRTSEYLVSEITTRGYPSGYISTLTGRIVPYPGNTSIDPPSLAISSAVSRLRTEIGSGSLIRVGQQVDRQGTFSNVDFIVSQDPRSRGKDGDYVLVLQATTDLATSSFTNIYDGITPGGYFKGTAGVVGSIVESRTVASITDNTNAVVSAAWSSTSQRYWGNNTSSSSTSARGFNIVSVNNEASVTMSATSGDSAAPITATISNLFATADRRFVLTGVNTSSNLTVSGGGVYANFTGKTATFAKLQSGNVPGFLLSGYQDGSTLTSDTTWVTFGIPGIDILGQNQGNVAGTSLRIGDSSFTVVSAINDTTILVTGSAIIRNFYNTSLVMYFPSYSSNISVTGLSTKFLPQITTATATSAGITIEEITEFGRTPDYRYGFLQIGVTSFAITSIINDTSLIVAGGPITESFASSLGFTYQYRRDYPLPRTIAASDSASFDKAGTNIGVDETLVTQGRSVDFTAYRTLYHNSSYGLSLAANAIIISTSVSVTAGSSIVLLVTWMKDFTNNAVEANNRLAISVSSSGTFGVYYDDEVQRNYRDVSLGQTLLYSNTFYVNSSNSITNTNVASNGATTSVASWTWIPYAINRSGVYSRFSSRFEALTDTSINVSVSVPAGYQWNSTTSDFVNITILGVS